ncbi:MAG: hypothetical protein LBI04_00630 [Treponema sp.]|jgi:hypothetical protein|nr:hypothetical protein [Treponema sp.]
MNKKCFCLFKLVFFTALFFMGLSLSAQSGRLVIEQRYVQQLVWSGDDYTLKYEVVIELDEGAGYREFTREFTVLPKFQIYLLPGNYRYRVIPFDFLEQPGEASNWINLNVHPAPIVPVEVRTDEEKNFVLTPYEDTQLVPGVSEIIIKNPDELESKEGVLTFENQSEQRKITTYLSAAWAPLVPLYGGIYEIFGNEFSFTGATLRFGLLFTQPELFYPGLELSTSWYALSKAQDSDTIDLQAGVIGINFIAQKWLSNQKIAFALRAGGGLTFQLGDLISGQDLYLMDRLVPQLNLEPSFLWLVFKQLYLEAGLGFTLFMNKDNSSGCLRPWLGLGWLF